MLAREDFELIQRYVEGDLQPADVDRAEALLSSNPEARAAAATLRTLSQMSDESVEPPPAAVGEIMSRIEEMASPRPEAGSRVRPFVKPAARESRVEGRQSRVEDVMSRRSSIVWGISAAAVIVLGVLWMGGILPPAPEGADATIGAAKRAVSAA